MRRTILTDKGVRALPQGRDQLIRDPEMRGHYVRIQSGTKTFVVVTRDPNGKQVWTKIGTADHLMSVAEARDKAREVITRVRAGLPAFEAPPTKPDSFEDIAEQWLKRHGEAKQLRSLKNIKRLLRVHVYRRWKNKNFVDLKRSDAARLLDHVEDNHGARQADLVLTVVRSIMNWFATRHDDYNPPVVRGMRRQDPKAHSRARILTDDELRRVWKAAERAGRFGAILRLCLLTAQRRTVVANMRWTDLFGDKWTIPQMPREKENAGLLQLPKVAVDIIRAQPQLVGNPYVFGMRQDKPFSGFSVCKTEFDKQLHDKQLLDLEPWVIHDLRRTARSLMSRAGIRPDIAERVMGHAINGVAGTYDRHSYSVEKADALQALANLIDGIIRPRDNVTPMRKRAKQRP
jgi:integrase